MDEYQHHRHQNRNLSSSSSVNNKMTNSTSLRCWLADWLLSVLPGEPKNWTIFTSTSLQLTYVMTQKDVHSLQKLRETALHWKYQLI